MFTQELLTLAAREGLKVFIMKFTDWLVTSGGYMRLDCYGRRSLFWLVNSLSSLELSLFGTSPGKQTFVSLNTNGMPKSSCGIDPVITMVDYHYILVAQMVWVCIIFVVISGMQLKIALRRTSTTSSTETGSGPYPLLQAVWDYGLSDLAVWCSDMWGRWSSPVLWRESWQEYAQRTDITVASVPCPVFGRRSTP